MTENDLISRSALLELAEVFSCYNPNCEDIECEFSFVNKADVENAPTIDPESLRPKGRWFLLDECSNAGVYCSVCTKKVYKEQYANQKLKSPYCPNCGAKMEVE